MMGKGGGRKLVLFILWCLVTDWGRVVTGTGRGSSEPDRNTLNTTLKGCYAKCPPGKFLVAPCLEGFFPQCTLCPAGSHSETWNLEASCSSCRGPCRQDMGLIEIQPCTKNSRRRCSCRSGTFCRNGMLPEDTTCTRCDPLSKCPPGEGVSRPGDHSRDTQCQKCPEGTFSNHSSVSDQCTPHRNCSSQADVQSIPGNATSDTVCFTLTDGQSRRGDRRTLTDSGPMAAFQSCLRDPEEPLEPGPPPDLREDAVDQPPLHRISLPLPRPSPEEDPLQGDATEGPVHRGEADKGGGIVGPVFIYNPARVYMGVIDQTEAPRPEGPRRCPSLPYPRQEAGGPDPRPFPVQEHGKENHLSQEASGDSLPGLGRWDRAVGWGAEEAGTSKSFFNVRIQPAFTSSARSA
ncbi:tumor necrosis factor receptor superfamily member 1B-like isoform X2 [Narcine bancroftii]|uniref:tumor necrosis factor receptor superfamily member 1B-like isoform X2 n=1 Tax=Narcine bancroftii TaxID=1343680 RepID=UPI0038319C85